MILHCTNRISVVSSNHAAIDYTTKAGAICYATQTDLVKALFTAVRNNDLPALKSMASKEGSGQWRGRERDFRPKKEASGKWKNGLIDRGNGVAPTLATIYGLAEIVRLLLNSGTNPSAEFPVPGVMKLLPAYSGKGVAPLT